MSSVGKAIGKVVGGITGATEAGKGAERAAATQAEAAQAGVDETRRQFDVIVKNFLPYLQAGTGALGQQQAILGLSGPQAQQAAIAGFEQSPIFQSMVKQQENSILQNAAATGGLRGGNVQAALSQFRPQLLDQLIQRQFSNLGGLTQIGQASAANQASAGLNTGANVANLLAQQGAARAGGQIAKSGVQRQAFGDLLQIGGTIAGLAF